MLRVFLPNTGCSGTQHTPVKVERAKNGFLGRAGRKFPLEKAQEAIEESQKDARGGKVLLEG